MNLPMDLAKLGNELRARRKEMGMPRAELARRVGVTPTYIWLIENARPRKGGEPSRPSQEVLLRWAKTLGMDHGSTNRALALAGYQPPEPNSREPGHFTVAMSRPVTMQAAPASEMRPRLARQAMARHMAAGDISAAGEAASLKEMPLSAAPVSFPPQFEGRRDALLEQARETLDSADAAGRGEEAADLLESFLDWLQYRSRSASLEPG